MLFQRKHNQGFTLIEVMLAAMLFSVIALSVYHVFSQGLWMEKRLQGGSFAGLDVLCTIDQLSKDLEQMVPFTRPKDGRMYLEGEHHEIGFLKDGPDGLEEIYYSLEEPQKVSVHRVQVGERKAGMENGLVFLQREESPKNWMLTKRTGDFLKGNENNEKEKEEILSRQIPENGLEFFYLGVDGQGKAAWKEKWSEKGWPSAIRVHLTAWDSGKSVEFVRDVFTGFSGVKQGGSHAVQ